MASSIEIELENGVCEVLIDYEEVLPEVYAIGCWWKSGKIELQAHHVLTFLQCINCEHLIFQWHLLILYVLIFLAVLPHVAHTSCHS